jgi:hypothetical protein
MALDRAWTTGWALYRNDAAAARASDAMVAAGIGRDGLLGYVAVPRGDDFDVLFVGGAEEAPEIRHVVHVSAAAAPVETLDPPRPLDGEAAAMYRARTVALAAREALARDAGLAPCGSPYNAAVLPASLLGETGWLVYLLAATGDPDRRILAGHLRVRFSEDGRTVLDATALSRGCLVVDRDPKMTSEELYVTHVLDPAPIETHVFTSLLYQVPLWVEAGGSTWRIDRDQIIVVVP